MPQIFRCFSWPTACLLGLGLAVCAHSQTPAETALPREVLQALGRAGVPASAVSIVVRRLPSVNGGSEDLLSHQASSARNPASVMKLVTTYAGLDILGPDFTWKTRIYTDGALNNGVLDGNLVVRGGGDPKLVVERITEMFAQVRAKGVREVRGDLLLDHSVFNLQAKNPADFDDEPLRPYNAAPDGLLVNFKSLIFTFSPDEANRRTLVRTEPPIAQVELPLEVPLAHAAATCGDWRSALRADFSDPRRVRFGGRYAASCGEKVWPVAYVQPQVYAGRVLQAMWLASMPSASPTSVATANDSVKTSLNGQTREDKLPPTAKLLLSSDSLPLREVIADINKFSNNVMAQQLFLSLSAYPARKASLPISINTTAAPSEATPAPANGPANRRASFEASQKILAAWWKKTLPLAKAPLLDNGSGLSRKERASAQSLSDLLHLAAASPHAEVFANSLGIAGIDGTVLRMRERNPGAQALSRAQLKTGTLKDVAAIAGYANTLSGQRLSVVALINHPNAGAARPALDALLEWMVVQ